MDGPHEPLPIHNWMLTNPILHRCCASSHHYYELTGTVAMPDTEKNAAQHSFPSSKSYTPFMPSCSVHWELKGVLYRSKCCGIYLMLWLQVRTGGKLSLESLKFFSIFYLISILYSLIISSLYLSLCLYIHASLCICAWMNVYIMHAISILSYAFFIFLYIKTLF